MEQDAPVLSGSLRDNLLLGNPEADEDAVTRVVATTRLDGLVARLAVPDDVFAQCRAHFDEATLIEMTQLVAMYVGVAMQTALIRPAFDTYRSTTPVLARPPAAA